MNKPQWASDKAKFDQAVLEVKSSGKELTDESLKEVYVRLKGLVLSDVLPASEEPEKPRASRRKTPKVE